MPRRKPSPSSDCEQPRKKWKRVIIYSDSDESDKSDSEQPVLTDNPTSDVTPVQADTLSEEPLELDADLLAALGDPGEDIPDYGEKILSDLAQRWLPILRKGIPKEKKDPLLKEYTIPENCKLLRSPALNVEMAAAISDLNRARDKRLETSQNQLGLAISAVGKGLSTLISHEDKQKKVQAIKSISDGCRILSDLHYNQTQTRVKLITPVLDKAFVRSIQDLERDETLFGSKLSEKIKATKTIEKQGLQIKRPPPVTRSVAPSSTQTFSTARSQSQGNWAGPSRYQPSSRGGRGAAQRYGSAGRKPTGAPSTGRTYPPSSSKQRAPTR